MNNSSYCRAFKVLNSTAMFFCMAFLGQRLFAEDNLSKNEKTGELYKKAVKLCKERKLSEAMQAFEDSYKEIGPEALFEKSACQTSFAQYLEAIKTLKRILADDNAASTDKQYAEDLIDEVEDETGFLEVERLPIDAEVMIDGKSYQLSTDHPKKIRVNPGSHKILVTKKGYKVEKRTVNVQPKITSKISIKLKPLQATLKIDCRPKKATIKLNGKKEGVCPYSQALPHGQYKIEIESSSYQPAEQTVKLEPGEKTVVQIDLVSKKPIKLGESQPVPKMTKKEYRTRLALEITGILVGTGIACGLGIPYTIKLINDEDRALTLWGDAQFHYARDEREKGDELSLKEDDIVEKEIPRDAALLAVGYGIGGAMIVSGLVLLALEIRYKRKGIPFPHKKKNLSSVSISASPSHFSLHF